VPLRGGFPLRGQAVVFQSGRPLAIVAANSPSCDEETGRMGWLTVRAGAGKQRGMGMSGILFGWVGVRRTAAVASTAAVLFLAGCQPGELFPQKSREGTDAAAAEPQMTEQDVEKPDVFSVTDSGLWDGRPSLGGVWVAHPDVDEPERVIIRNSANDRFVIGALFRRERDNPGPSRSAGNAGRRPGDTQRGGTAARDGAGRTARAGCRIDRSDRHRDNAA